MASKDNYCLGRALTDREKEIVALVAKGRTNDEIATLLGIAYSTTKNHIAHIFNKIGARSRGDIIIYYYIPSIKTKY